MTFSSKGLALVPELVLSSPCSSALLAAASATVLSQSLSQGWKSWLTHVQAREWAEKPYFMQERLSGTRLETVLDPPNGIKYIKVVKVYPPAPVSIWTVLRPRGLTLSLCKSLLLQCLVVIVPNLARLDAAEKEAIFDNQDPPSIPIFTKDDINPVVMRSSINFLRDIATQGIRQALDVLAGQNLDPRLAWKLRKGFKTSAVRKQYLPWYIRPFRITKTVIVSCALTSVAEWTVTSYIDVYRMTKVGWQKHGVTAFTKRLLLRLIANAVKTTASLVSASIGAGIISVVWPGTGTLLGYNAADLAMTFFVVGPLADQYFGSYTPSAGPPPAVLDGGALANDDGTVSYSAGIVDDSSDNDETLHQSGRRLR